MTIGTKIKKTRELRNFTQEYVAEKLGVSQANYSKIERDEVKLKPEKVKRIAEILDVEPEQLENVDEKIIFNVQNNTIEGEGQLNAAINHYTIASKLEKLYEDKIKLLEEKIRNLEQKRQ